MELSKLWIVVLGIVGLAGIAYSILYLDLSDGTLSYFRVKDVEGSKSWRLKRQNCYEGYTTKYFRDFGKDEADLYPKKPICQAQELKWQKMEEIDCGMIGWDTRKDLGRRRKVFDITLFGYDYDTLELRWRTLNLVVDGFIVIESQRTYTNRSRFSPQDVKGTLGRLFEPGARFHDLKDKVTHHLLMPGDWPGEYDVLTEGESFEGMGLRFEAWMRGQYLNETILKKAGVQEGDLLMSSDADELSRASLVNILRFCSMPRENAGKLRYDCTSQSISQWQYPMLEDTMTYTSFVEYNPMVHELKNMEFRNRLQPGGEDLGTPCVRFGGWSCSGCGLSSPLELLRKTYWQSHPYGPPLSEEEQEVFDGLKMEPDTMDLNERVLGWRREMDALPVRLKEYMISSIGKLAKGQEPFEGGDVYRIVDVRGMDLPWWLDAVIGDEDVDDEDWRHARESRNSLDFVHFVDRERWGRLIIETGDE